MMKLRFTLSILCLFIVACSHQSQETVPTHDILAQVGNRLITKDDFIRRVEYTIRPTYCKGINYIHKKIMLNSLIAEKLFAIEGNQSGLMGKSERFARFIQGRKEQAMRQWYYYDQVYSNVQPEPDDIQAALAQSGRTIDVSYFRLPNETFAQQARDALNGGVSFNEIFSVFANRDTLPHKKISWFDREENEIHDALFRGDLEKGEILGPLQTEDGTFLVMKVKGWTDEPTLTENELNQRRNDVEKRLKEQKALKVYAQKMAAMMQGKKMQFNEPVFKQYVTKLGDEFFKDQAWKKKKVNQSVGFEDEVGPQGVSNNLPAALLDQPLVQVDDEWYSVKEFEQLLQSHPLVFREKKISKSKFASEFQKAVADLFQDIELTKECYRLHYDTVSSVRLNTELWKDYYVAKEYRNRILEKSDLTDSLKTNETEAITEILNPVVRRLEQKYSDQIKIDADWLKNVYLTTTDMTVLQPQMPYAVVVPAFPKTTTYSRLDYGQTL